MIARLEQAQKWTSRFLVTLVIVAAVSKDHVFEIFAQPAEAAPTAQRGAHNVPPVGAAPSTDGVGEALPIGVAPLHDGAATSPSVGVPHHPPQHVGVSFRIRALYIMALILMYALLESIVELSITKARWVRSLVMGVDNIEGYWLDIVFQDDKVVAGGLVQIKFCDGAYVVEGRDFDKKAWTGWFKTEVSRYDDNRLLYKYRALRPGGGKEGTGHGEYNFNTGLYGRRLTEFVGHFFEDDSDRRYFAYGERLSAYLPQKKDRLERTKPENIAKLVAEFLENRRAVLPLDLRAASVEMLPRARIAEGKS